MILRGLREVDGVEELVDIFDITEFTYTGKDMGERAITATIYHPSPIDFRAGDYAEFQIQSLERATGGMDGSIITEKFYIYTMPTIKKTARPMTHGQAFEHTLTLYPAQYELALVQMRDLGNRTNPDSIIYTGFDSVTFYGGAKELMERIMMVLDEAYGKGTWSYKLSNEVNEEVNDALEKFLFTFSGNTVMDALLKLNDKEGINTTFFINDRTIYVGFKRSYFCRVLDSGSIDTDIDTQMFNMRYGKTSHESIAINYGCLFDITKSVGKETPITKLFAYGAARNLNRFYCSDRIKTGRYVNRLMLPSFDADGKTDFILSEKGIEKFGIREGSKQFEDIYPSLRYVNYGDIRQIQYCIKLKVSGLDGETKDNASFPIARVQCYKVVPSTINVGVNALVECAPPEDIAVYIHTIDSVVKVVLYGGATDAEAIAKQRAHDTIVPTRTKGGTDYIPGSCFAVHDRGFDDAGTTYENANRSAWFTNPNDLETSTLTEQQKAEIQNNQVTYANTPFITDLYRFVGYNQTYFSRDGYSAWGWARLNSNYVSEGGIIAHDSLLVNEVVAVEPVVIPDTDLNIAGLAPRQQTFDVYLRDLGFKLDEQNDFGEMVFVLNGEVKVSFIDGTLGGREFNVAGKVTDFQENCICAFNDDATLNEEFFLASGYTDPYIAEKAFADGAIWRLRLIRSNLDEPSLSNLAIALPTPELNAKQGDHVVLLDLFMPDIYVHAAENRLLREAQQYLDANDNGSISYAVNFDEVRMQQIPNYALQIREGLQIRMEDADLAITTENDVKKIFNGKLVSNTSLYKTTYEEEIVDKYYYTTEHRDYYDIERGGIIRYRTLGGKQYIDNPSVIYFKRDGSGEGMFSGDGSWSGMLYALEGMIQSDYDNPNFELFADNGKVTVRLLKREVTANGTGYSLTDNYAQFSVSNIKKSTSGGAHGFTANCYKGAMSSFIGNIYLSNSSQPDGQFEVYCIVEYDIKERHTYEGTQFTPNTHLLGWGSQIYCPSKILTEFRAKKHYAIEMKLYNTELLVLDTKSYPVFALINNLGDDAMIYQPICEKMDMLIGSTSVTFKFEFDTIEGFNDSQDYYPAILYKSDNKTEYIKTELLSITESDYEGNGDLPYADFVLDTVTIQVSDNSQREVGSAPVKTISATLSEQQDASAWATLMNKVDEAVIEGEANAAAVENLVNSARKNYLSILSLKDSIFDPDGTCDQTFLQVMMMQIGADSMNYRMLKTNVDMNGVPHNCRLFVDGTTSKFEAGSDTLYHYVYTQGAQGGTWEITPLSEIALDGTSVYYIALKCQREGMNGEWICETAQHKVDEDATHWYFNWGILTVDSAGVYTLIETRGNAYMYGDNLICGKISDLAKKSWFDLTRGEFVLGHTDSGAALEYKNGVLTIGGVNDNSVGSILNRLGLAESNISDALDAIADEEEARMQAIANLESIQESLQSQIDGEVTSWFLEGEPKNNNAPASDWTTDKLKQRHEGDTYTSISEYPEPSAGQSWRWCNCEYTDENGQKVTGWHWHKIADSDAVKALAEAAKAKATADGKSKTFVVQPTNYEIGDLWILQSDTDHTAGKKGDILTANAASTTYVASHWSKEVKYTDDTAIENLEIGARNLLRNSKIGNNLDYWAASGTNITLNNGVIHCVGNNGSYPRLYNTSLRGKTFELNATYTLSLWIRSSVNANRIIRIDDGNNTNRIMTFGDVPLTTEWQHLKLSAVCEKAEATTQTLFQIWVGENNVNGEAGKFDNTNWIEVKELKLEKGTKATDWTPAPEDVDNAIAVAENRAAALEYLKETLTDGTTDIGGGLIATNLILMRNIDGVIRGGISGIDDDSGINNGVAFWSGGDYESALLQARLDTMSKTLPVLLTKKGVGSNIGCFEVVSSNQVAIYNSNRTSRILYTIGYSTDISMKFQTKNDSGVFVDLFVADNSSVDTNIVSKIMNGNPDGDIVKNTDVEYTGVYKTSGLSIPQGYKASINSGHKAVFIMKFNCDTYVKRLKFGAGSKLEFMRVASSTSDVETQYGSDVNLEGIEATVDMKNDYVKFEVPLPECSSTLTNGWYYFKITATKFIRTNTSGSSAEVTFDGKDPIMERRINKGEVLFALKQDLSFTKVEDTDTSMIRIGSDGLKVAVNSSTNFIIKTAAKNNKLNFIINGLPSASQVSTTGQIYSDGGTLKVYGG